MDLGFLSNPTVSNRVFDIYLQDDGTSVQAHLAYAIEDLGTPVVQYDVSYTFTRVGEPVTITGPMGDQSG